jgi:hypothetical protein
MTTSAAGLVQWQPADWTAAETDDDEHRHRVDAQAAARYLLGQLDAARLDPIALGAARYQTELLGQRHPRSVS